MLMFHHVWQMWKKKIFVCLQLFATLFLCTKAWCAFADGRSTVKESPDLKT